MTKALKKKRVNFHKILVHFVFWSLLLSTIYTIAHLIYAPVTSELAVDGERIKSEYVLMLIQCILGMFAILLPGIIYHRLKLEIPSRMIIAYTVFLYCAIYLGEIRSFYYIVPHWDTVLHTFSGTMLGALGFSFINFLNKIENFLFTLSPLFVAIFSLCFALSIGVAWEIYEFTIDCFFGTNMQKFALESGEYLVGQTALKDTMKDMIVDFIGAGTMALAGYLSLKYQTGFLRRIIMNPKKKG